MRPGPTSLVPVEGGHELVVSEPIPLHACLVKYQADGFTVKLVSVPGPTQAAWFATVEAARAAAARIVNRRTVEDMKRRFDPAQRYAMGQQKCPYRQPGGRTLCNEPCEQVSVWCLWHPKGRRREDC